MKREEQIEKESRQRYPYDRMKQGLIKYDERELQHLHLDELKRIWEIIKGEKL